MTRATSKHSIVRCSCTKLIRYNIILNSKQGSFLGRFLHITHLKHIFLINSKYSDCVLTKPQQKKSIKIDKSFNWIFYLAMFC